MNEYQREQEEEWRKERADNLVASQQRALYEEGLLRKAAFEAPEREKAFRHELARQDLAGRILAATVTRMPIPPDAVEAIVRDCVMLADALIAALKVDVPVDVPDNLRK